MRTAPKIELSVEDGAWLEKMSRSRGEVARLSERALIVLMPAEGKTNREIVNLSRFGGLGVNARCMVLFGCCCSRSLLGI